MNLTDFASTIKYPSNSYKLDEITAVSATLFYSDHRLGDSKISIPDTEGRDYNRIQGLVKDHFKQYCAFKNFEYSLPLFKSFEPIDILKFGGML
ncbi:uncharacterized protein PHALS_14244 [Plasmopara halstedii]|uniref:Uncharacterized protein n=1 Tax=Plasmopara halstedii TaxID=4781 RepID=A0A0P1AQV0_PLAHL|nr:uncharacterized protein PHALS_14244 [Plasmopara halstedii]CEG43969.1 hypothetical protein PHALS_14244 [Plasmopara halstedii]|eukprot:XP_024580338.1 hypothetical protein PHALS_14244 [Plasmopara halstedii]